jgi:prolyl oligopeptidase
MSLMRPIVEKIHGILLRDPYRWLENRTLPETEGWIRDQQRRSEQYFAGCPALDVLERRVQAYLDVEVVDQPACVADRYFFRKRSVGQQQGRICMREASSGEDLLLVDPSPDGPYTSVAIHRISADGAFLAYEVKRGGEDRKEIRVVDVQTRIVLPNGVPSGYARGFAFSRDGYFYCQEIDPDIDGHVIRYQSLGSADQGRVVFRAPRTSGSRLILTANAQRLGALWFHPEGARTLADFWFTDLVEQEPAWVEVFRNRRTPSSPILWHDRILVLVDGESYGSQIIEMSRNGHELRVFVPAKETPIRQIAVTRDRIFVSYLEQGVTTIDSWLLSGQPAGPIDLPSGGTIQLLPVHSQDADSFFFTYESFDIPPAIYQHHSETNVSVPWCQRGPIGRNRRSHVRETTIRSKDGTPVPLTLVSAESNQMCSSPQPVIMTGYGGFGASMTPQFSVFVTIMMELGVILAIPHIRGGGEFGRAWHDAGRARNRQVCFDDFIAAAEWLLSQRISTTHQLAIFGGSNAGLLVATAMTQRPDLFGAVLCIAPLLDMVRYESFDQASRWRHEYGTIEDQEDLRTLVAYSPYHHIADAVDYPPTLFVSGDKDDRCNPAHVRKMAAALQGRNSQRSPVIVDYSDERGHAPVLPLSVRVEALARRIAFLCRELGIPLPKGGLHAASHS